jgi:hypothetical protein
MSELTAEKWAELAAKLEAESVAADVAGKAAAGKARWLLLVVLLLAAVTFTLAAILQDTRWGMAAATPPGLLMMVAIGYVMRYRQLVRQARADVDRIQRDIRQWKKKKPVPTPQ